ncbi:endolysin [Vibrio phage NF]|uniref:N-acetylmuramoyl-L-alanine amidase n=1 Tax=Vibrio phage NF TaxID=2686202 RepID=A0A6B9J013_9CAUD|nr:endolysin [Vibrio phage NF]QGZ13247.1 N-acetylmuramoyl-L-alanine amidase [Vibrio phage NF]
MNPKYITVHCSATTPSPAIDVQTIRRWHTSKGWSDIGYHFVIKTDGKVQPGRPLTRNGAGVKGHNKDNIHICLIGGVDINGKSMDNFTDLQWDALRLLITELCGNYGIKESNIKGHRDWFGDSNGDGVIDRRDWFKDCPCFDVQDKLKEWGND